MGPVRGEVEHEVACRRSKEVDAVEQAVHDRRATAGVGLARSRHERGPAGGVGTHGTCGPPSSQWRADLPCEHDGSVVGNLSFAVVEHLGPVQPTG